MAAGDPTDLLEAAIYTALTTYSDLTDLLADAGQVYQDQAPPAASSPLVIFAKVSGEPTHTLGTRNAYASAEYQVKGVTEGHSRQSANAIAAEIDLALDGRLSVSGYTVGFDRRVSDVALPEDGEGGRHYQHRGGVYRFDLFPN